MKNAKCDSVKIVEYFILGHSVIKNHHQLLTLLNKSTFQGHMQEKYELADF